MSTTSRSPDEKPESSDVSEKKRAGSPGRYSLADDGDAVPPTRIDSTTRMPAIRPDIPPRSTPGGVSPSARESSASIAASRAAIAIPKDDNEPKKKAPIGLPSKALPQQGQASQRAVPAPIVRAAAPPAPPTPPPASARGTGASAEKTPASRLPDVRPPAKSSDSITMEEKKGTDATDASRGAPNAGSRAPSIPPATTRSASVRPPAANKAPSAPPAFGLEGFDEGSIAFAFDALVSEDRPSLPGTHEFDLAPVRELFAELAANHMRHVRDFMLDVKWGEVTRDWIDICVPPVRTLRRAAERLDLAELASALDVLARELDAANAVGGQMLDSSEKQRLLDAYGKLVEILPQAFALDRDKTQREAVIVQALLLQVPDVRKVTIDKLHAAGLTSLTVLFEANAHDIAHVAGIPHSLATRIVERVQAYRAELKASSPQDARAAEREKLAGLNGQLKQHHDAYEAAANDWGPGAKAKKRDCFRAREETWLEISVLLARFGEVDRLQGIEKVPFAQRIAQLSEYLEEARDKYRSPET